MGAQCVRELHREAADPAGGPVDQHPLTFPQVPVIQQALPGTEPRQGDGCALDVTERPRLGSKELLRDDDVLGRGAVAIKAAERIDRLAGGGAIDVPADRGDDARELIRRGRREPVGGPLELVARDRGRVDANQHLAPTRPGRLDLLAVERGGVAGRLEPNRAHRGRNVRSRWTRSGHLPAPFRGDAHAGSSLASRRFICSTLAEDWRYEKSQKTISR